MTYFLFKNLMIIKMKKQNYIYILAVLFFASCGKDYLELNPRGTTLETNFYKTQEELFQGLVAVYDVAQWGSAGGYTMVTGLMNAASDDCFAGGSDASDQPSWVAYDNFTLNPTLGPQEGLWIKYFAGIYRANLIIEKLENAPADIPANFKARGIAEAKFFRAFFYFDLIRYFKNVPLITTNLGTDEIEAVTQVGPSEIYAQVEKDLREARAEAALPESVPPNELGRITKGAVSAMLG